MRSADRALFAINCNVTTNYKGIIGAGFGGGCTAVVLLQTKRKVFEINFIKSSYENWKQWSDHIPLIVTFGL